MRQIKQTKTITLILLTLILILFNFTGCVEKENKNISNDNVEYGEQFTFQLLDGTQKNIKDYQGKVVLLDFMGANCAPCQMQLFTLYDIYQNYSEYDFEIISIDVWVATGESAQTMYSLLNAYAEYGYTLDWAFGLDDKIGTLYFKYADAGVPRMYILDKNGNIYYDLEEGYKDYSFITEKLNEIL